MLNITIFNTLTRKKELFIPRGKIVKIYACGPTPYNYVHIGNLRNYIITDFITTTLKYFGYTVHTGMNITDIDDKTIRDSQKSDRNLKEFTEFFTKEFFLDCNNLSIERPDSVIPISNLIGDMELIIQGLLDKGYAYLAEDGSIYYSVSRFKKYGEFANLDLGGMISSVRINNDEYEKEQVADFALWKAYNEMLDGPNKWTIQLTINNLPVKIDGRPGWHIECSACNFKIFGEQIDIHVGGVDLIFPHHQNEIAQTEAFTGKQFSKYWLHCGHLLVENKKMSKSVGNFLTLKDVIRYSNEKLSIYNLDIIHRGFRLMNLYNHYRDNYNFTFNGLDSSIRTVSRIDELIIRLSYLLKDYGDVDLEMSKLFLSKDSVLNAFLDSFQNGLADNFNSISSLQSLFALEKYANQLLDDGRYTKEKIFAIIGLLDEFNKVLKIINLSMLHESKLERIPPEIKNLADERYKLKNEGNYGKADELRDKILQDGWRIDDKKGGYHLIKLN